MSPVPFLFTENAREHSCWPSTSSQASVAPERKAKGDIILCSEIGVSHPKMVALVDGRNSPATML